MSGENIYNSPASIDGKMLCSFGIIGIRVSISLIKRCIAKKPHDS
jgi:hypothetical protein